MIISVKLWIVYLEISCTCLELFYNATVRAFNALILYSNGYDYLITEGKFYFPLYGLRNQYQR
jgi:hypothetical protein